MPHPVQIRISERTHQRLKLAAVLLDKTLQETADQLLLEQAEAVISQKQPSPSAAEDNHAS